MITGYGGYAHEIESKISVAKSAFKKQDICFSQTQQFITQHSTAFFTSTLDKN